MQASPVRIIEYFDGRKQSLVPLFQRPYTWEKDKWLVLWEDIMSHYDADENVSHFMGAVVSIPVKTVPVGVNKHLVIDGQQRLTTLAILLAALRDEGASTRIDDYLFNRNDEGADRLKLLPTQADRDVYKRIVLDRALPTAPSRVKAAYEFFRQRLRENYNSTSIDPLRVLETIEQRLQVVMINLGDSDDPYLIFESLNAKGQPLTQADLVRNYVLMKFHHSLETGGEQERVYESYWRPLQDSLGENLTDFLRHYCMKDGTDVEKRNVYSAIKKRLPLENTALEAELKNMKQIGEYYVRFLDPAKEEDDEVRKRLEAFVELDVTTCYPLLMQLFDYRNRGDITDTDLKQCLRLIESLVVRRAVCAVPTNSLGKMFMQWSKDFKADDAVKWLGSKMASGSGNARWPTDATFKAAFHSEQYARKATRHVLTSLEKGFEHKEPVNLSTATIEHVMPQELSVQWEQMLGSRYLDVHQRLLHTFGNLTLTGYNSELGNLAFDQKRKMLSESHIDLNRWICEQDHWDEQTIESRSTALADSAATMWEGPGRFFDSVTPDKRRGEQSSIEKLTIDAKGISASGYESSSGFIVLAGSQVVRDTVPSIHQYLLVLRTNLSEKGILVPDGDQLVLREDQIFDSPSTAAGVVLGRSANGRIEWKNAQGKTLRDIQESQTHEQE
jgi:uncharacterized protein with ParB-like and HNH nuclease domain